MSIWALQRTYFDIQITEHSDTTNVVPIVEDLYYNGGLNNQSSTVYT